MIAASTTRRLAGALLLLLLAAAPTQWSLPLPGRVHVTPADLLLLAALLAGSVHRRRVTDAWDALRRLPWAHAAFAVLMFVAALRAPLKGLAAREWLQATAYFVIAYLLVDSALREGGAAWLRRGLRVFLAVGAVIVATAAWQYVAGEPDPLVVRGTFGNRNVLGGYLSLLLPLGFGLLLGARCWRARILYGALLVAGLLVLLSGPAMLAIVIVLLAMAAARGPRVFAATGVLLLSGYLWLLPALPRGNDRELFVSTALYDDNGQPTRRYPEWQAATILALDRPWFGIGPGAYQRQIGRYTGTLPNATGPSEPDIQNLYLVLAATCGLPACAAFLAMLWTGMAAAARAGREPDRGLGIGLAGGLAAFALTALWNPLLVRGIGLPLAMMLAATRHVGLTAPCGAQETRSPCA